jgi:quinol monooxygenase YgiN
MYARVSTAQIKPDRWDEAIRATEDIIVPAAKKQKGFKGYLGLGDRVTGKSIVVTFWETEADRQASSQDTPYYHEVISKIAPLLNAAPVAEDLEVVIQE